MDESTLPSLLQSAIQDIKQGNLKAGQIALGEIINTEPDSIYAEKAWLWLSATFADPDQKRRCLDNALKINPDNKIAKKGLAKLPPPKIEDTVDFEDPDWLTDDSVTSETLSNSHSLKKQSHTEEVQKVPKPPRKGDQQLIDEYVALKTAKGWQIINYTGATVQLRKPKQWDRLLLVLGLLLSCIGIGLFILLLALIDYLAQKEQVVFVTADELRRGVVENETKSRSLATVIIVLVVVVIGISFLLSLITSLL